MKTKASVVPTREIFGNVPDLSRWLFYALSVVAIGVFAWGVWRRVRLWRLGRRTEGPVRLTVAARRLLVDALLQSRIFGRGLTTLAHLLLFSGFVVLLIGTILIGIEHWLADVLGREAGDPVFHFGTYYVVYEFVMDTFGVALLAGCVLFLSRRWRRPASLDHAPLDWAVLIGLLAIGVTGYLVEGLRMIVAADFDHSFSYVGLLSASGFVAAGVTPSTAGTLHLVLWWLHALLALGLIAAIPYTRLLHFIAGTVNIAASTSRLGVMQPISMEEVEQTGRVGVGRIVDFSRTQLLELDACVACGRCEEACPAHAAGKPLSPKRVVQDVRRHLDVAGPAVRTALSQAGQGANRDETIDGVLSGLAPLHGGVISAETLWSCTTCHACVDVCPLRVSPLGMITDMRRHLIGEGELRGPPAASLQKVQRSGNPWGLAKDDRLAWAAGLDVPTVAENPGFEYLYWVGCAAAYDRRVQQVARSVVRLLTHAGVNFSVLGTLERCTGESARRMGDEFVFQELAAANISALEAHRTRKIVTHCPHCLNSIRHDYPQFGGEFEVVHHSQLLAELISTRRLPKIAPHLPREGLGECPAGPEATIAFHDPCYLARVNAISEAPREVLATAGARITEPPHNRRHTACCGAGGGRMWFDDPPSERIGRDRVQELLAIGAQTVATACPFCLIMTRDGIASENSHAEVKDVAEILAERLFASDSDGK